MSGRQSRIAQTHAGNGMKSPLPNPRSAPDHLLASRLTADPAVAETARRWARTYLWWKTPEEILRDEPSRLVAQVMDVGTYEDVLALERLLGPQLLRAVLVRAQAGWLRPRSWAFWHYRLGLVAPGEPPPPLPARRIGAA